MASTFTSLLTQIVRPYNISTDNAGYLGASFIIAGLVGAALTGIFIDKTGRHKIVIKTYVPIVGALYLAFYFVGKKRGLSLSIFDIYLHIFNSKNRQLWFTCSNLYSHGLLYFLFVTCGT
jgi:MFS family permease